MTTISRRALLLAPLAQESHSFHCDNNALQTQYDEALKGLAANTKLVAGYPRPVLYEGAVYPGIWMECGPTESLVFAPWNMQTASDSHQVFFDLQKLDDGQIPAWVRGTGTGFGQIQMVVPIAATAWDLYKLNRNAAFLELAYKSCSRWDDWLRRYRDTRKTGLCEAFCEYDTGHDHSPRWEGKPKHCPDSDARICAKVDGLPYLAPDLSATVYGGRIALAAMARELHRRGEESKWLELAANIRKTLLDRLYEPSDGAFYDIDGNDKVVRIRGDVITRVLGEHVVDQKIFENVWSKQLGRPEAFWTKYPFPSIAFDDPTFVRPIPRNSWGGATQALTALRTHRWMEHYGRYSEFRHLASQWVEALVRSKGFRQQMDPQTGDFTTIDPSGYSPAMLMLVDSAWRLYGARPTESGFEFNCRLPEGASSLKAFRGSASIETNRQGSILKAAGQRIEVKGECRLIADKSGKPVELIGTAARAVTASVDGVSKQLAPNARVKL